jgi:putative transposase
MMGFGAQGGAEACPERSRGNTEKAQRRKKLSTWLAACGGCHPGPTGLGTKPQRTRSSQRKLGYRISYKEPVGADSIRPLVLKYLQSFGRMIFAPTDTMIDKSQERLPRRKSLRLKGFDYGEAACSYFVTICADKQLPLLVEPRAIQAIEQSISKTREFGALVHCYCIMPDHLHMLISLVNCGRNMSRLLHGFKYSASRKAGRRLWQRSFHDHILRPSENPKEICRYILENPIRKGLVADFNQWPYATMFDPL